MGLEQSFPETMWRNTRDVLTDTQILPVQGIFCSHPTCRSVSTYMICMTTEGPYAFREVLGDRTGSTWTVQYALEVLVSEKDNEA